MPKIQTYDVYTIVAAGATKTYSATDNIDVYEINANGGAVTLLADMIFSYSGTPKVATEFKFQYGGGVTSNSAGGVTVSFFGTDLTDEQALSPLNIEAYWNGSAWEIKIFKNAYITGSFGSTSNSAGLSINGSVLNMQPASSSFGGGVSTTTQTFSGAKTFSSDITVNSVTIGRGGGGLSTNTAIGITALSINSTGQNNSAEGYLSLSENTTGEFNSSFGSQSLRQNSTGVSNSSFGYASLFTNTSGSYNSSFGQQSLELSLTGAGNSSFGYRSLRQNITGYSNSVFGRESSRENTVGYENTSIGSRSMLSSKAGNKGTAIGFESQFYANDTAIPFDNTNVSMGYRSLLGSAVPANNIGLNNVAIGFESLEVFTTASDNTALGYLSLTNNITGNYNTAAGSQAGLDITTGGKNTLLGYNTGRGLTAGVSNTIVGANVTGLSGALSNNIILADGDGVVRLQFSSAGVLSLTGPAVTVSAATASTNKVAVTIGGSPYFVLLTT